MHHRGVIVVHNLKYIYTTFFSKLLKVKQRCKTKPFNEKNLSLLQFLMRECMCVRLSCFNFHCLFPFVSGDERGRRKSYGMIVERNIHDSQALYCATSTPSHLLTMQFTFSSTPPSIHEKMYISQTTTTICKKIEEKKKENEKIAFSLCYVV